MISGDLNTQFSSGDINETSIILEKYNLAKIIDKTKLRLKDTRTQLPDIGFISCCLLSTINFNIGAIKKHDQKMRIEGILTDLIFEIYIDFLNRSFLGPESIIEEIIKSTAVSHDLCGCDFNVFKKLIDFYKMDRLISQAHKSIYLKPLPSAEAHKSKLMWNGKGRLEELIFQLRERKLIKTKTHFFNLFINQHADNTIVKWDFERKGHLAYLLHQLHVKDFMRLVSGKGYFSYAETHFTGFDDTPLKKDSLKKLSSSMNSEPLKYKYIINEVDEIIRAILPQ